MNIIAQAISPQLTMIRAIQVRAPTRARMRLLGISQSTYPRKKMPAPKPYIAGLNPSSRFICSAAKPMFTRSRKQTM